MDETWTIHGQLASSLAAIGKGGGPCFRAIEQDGDNQGAIHVDLGSYADAVFAKEWIR